MIWPRSGKSPASAVVDGYSLRFACDREAFEQVQAAAGWVVSAAQWDELTAEMAQDGMVLVETAGAPVAAACAMRRADNWAEISWVAVAVEHRGRGLGKMVCAALTRHLLATGREHLFGSTQDERLAALRIYLELGFHPIHRAAKNERWRAVCAALNHPYTPDTWGWPSH